MKQPLKSSPKVFTRLDDLIKLKYRTIKGFSEKALYGQSTISEKLRGVKPFNTEEIKAWCRALEIPKEEIPFYFFQDME